MECESFQGRKQLLGKNRNTQISNEIQESVGMEKDEFKMSKILRYQGEDMFKNKSHIRKNTGNLNN